MLCKVSSSNEVAIFYSTETKCTYSINREPLYSARGESHFPGRRIYLDFDLEFHKHHLHYIFLSILEINAFGEKDVLFVRLLRSEERGEMDKMVRRNQQALTGGGG